MPKKRKGKASDAPPGVFKEGINAQVVQYYADGLSKASDGFNGRSFERRALDGLSELELKARVKHIAKELFEAFDGDYEAGLAAMMKMLSERKPVDGPSFAFAHWPLAQFVEDYGVEYFEPSALAMREITKHFSCEFAVRPFLVRYPDRMLAVMRDWAEDESVDVRRNASEGVRPRLPWGIRLQAFVDDPRPVLELLELLRRDPEEYVRRSVSNCLNDIAKDHPELLMDTLERWDGDPDPASAWIKKRALRSLVKAGNPRALALLGYARPSVRVSEIELGATSFRVGDAIDFSFEITSTGKAPQHLLVDYRVHFVKANGETRPKVFKLKTLSLGPGERVTVQKRQHLKPISTRRYYPGTHRLDVQVNGEVFADVAFELVV